MRYTLLVLSFFILISCKKDTIDEGTIDSPPVPEGPKAQLKYDTILPDDYLPVYPGSWWKYQRSDNMEIWIDSTDKNYLKDVYYKLSSSGTILSPSDTAFVPAYYSHNFGVPSFIWGNKQRRVQTSSYSAPFMLLVSDSLPIRTSWYAQLPGGSVHAYYSYMITAKDTSIYISGITYSPTIVITFFTQVASDSPIRLSQRYFTKNIGLVKFESFVPVSIPSKVSYEENIVSYHINR